MGRMAKLYLTWTTGPQYSLNRSMSLKLNCHKNFQGINYSWQAGLPVKTSWLMHFRTWTLIPTPKPNPVWKCISTPTHIDSVYSSCSRYTEVLSLLCIWGYIQCIFSENLVWKFTHFDTFFGDYFVSAFYAILGHAFKQKMVMEVKNPLCNLQTFQSGSLPIVMPSSMNCYALEALF